MRIAFESEDGECLALMARCSAVVMAMTSGANSVKAAWRFGERLTMAQRRLLCLRHDKDRFGKPHKAHFKGPSCVTFYKCPRKLDPVDFGEKLSASLQSQEGTLPRSRLLGPCRRTARREVLRRMGARRMERREVPCAAGRDPLRGHPHPSLRRVGVISNQ